MISHYLFTFLIVESTKHEAQTLKKMKKGVDKRKQTLEQNINWMLNMERPLFLPGPFHSLIEIQCKPHI